MNHSIPLQKLTQVLTLLLVAIVALVPVTALTITGVYYDPVQAETGGEAIQLENLGDTAIDLTTVTLVTKSGLVALPARTVLPGGAFLIADTGWSGGAGLRDNLSWPDADLETGLSLANTESWVELRDKSTNDTLSTLAWNATFKAREGKLLTPTGEAPPVFRNSSSTVTLIPVTIIVSDGPPIIANVTVTDDAPAPGIQLLSYARTIRVTTLLSEPNGEAFSAVARLQGRDTEFIAQTNNTDPSLPSLYSADIAVQALAPGSYALEILASDGSATASQTLTLTVLASSSVAVSGPLRFAGVPGATTRDSITVTNQGNVPRTVSVQHVPAGAVCGPLTFVLAPSASQTLDCSLTIPAGKPGEIRERVTVLVA